jgi:PAS domain S-box-containing protein
MTTPDMDKVIKVQQAGAPPTLERTPPSAQGPSLNELTAEIAALKLAERQASEWRNRYELIIASAGLAVYDVDRCKGEVFWAGAEQVLGLDPAKLDRCGEGWLELIHPDDRDSVRRAIANASATALSFDVQYRLRQGSDHFRWIQDRGFAIPDDKGACVRIIGMIQDVTQRKLAEDTMREQATLLDQTQDAIMVRDLENNILYWNLAAQRLFGWTFGEVLGKPVHELLLQGNLGHLPEARAAALKDGQWSGEVKLFTKDKKELTIGSRWKLLRDRDGKPYAFLVANTDLTDQKLLEAKFLRAQRLESVGALASGIAHDLNNVFTPIMMTAQLLGDPLDDATRKNMLGVLLTSARRGSEMVKQVLTFARGADGEAGFVQIRHLLKELEQLMRDTLPPGIQVDRNIASDLLLVRGDATQLYQVFLNLCVNARDAMPSGGTLRLEAANVHLDPDNSTKEGSHVCISISDTGTGMTPEVKKRIFEPFFTTKGAGKGTGLGLSTVMTLVKGHGGVVEVESEVGVGTKFKILLPAEKAQTAEAGSANSGLPDGRGELLLVVDDESAIREILKTTLEAHNYDVLLAEEGTEALALYAANRERVALVLTDLSMPVLDGHSTIRALKKMNPGVKLIAASGALEPDRLEHISREVGAFLAKPFSPDQLLNTVYNVLNPEVN